MTALLNLGLALLLVLLPLPADAARYVCEGDPLTAELHQGAVDATEIPNTAGGTVPGAFVVIAWRGVSLQLPRTNNAGGCPQQTNLRRWSEVSNIP